MGHKMQRSVLLTTWILATFVNLSNCYIVNPGPTYVSTKGDIWPKPQSQNIFENYYVLQTSRFKFVASGHSCNFLNNAFQRYFKILQQNTIPRVKKTYYRKTETDRSAQKKYLGELSQLTVNLLGVCDDAAYPTIDMDESYTLLVNSNAELVANSIWGILRGLESFSQLAYLESDGISVRINSSTIVDYPRFKHRGLLVDTARHYIPVEKLHQIIDGMAFNKMNVFHWHIVDDQSFPFVSESFPELSAMGAYDPELFIYTPDDVQGIIEYARQRGIRVMPEFDTPGHTRSWGVSHPELLTKCDTLINGSYGPMDPSKDITYSFVSTLLTEVKQKFRDTFIHLGADEVEFDCWENDENIGNFMLENSITTYAHLESYYIEKIIKTATRLNFSSIVWEEAFKNGVNLPQDTIVHVWRNWTGTYWNDTMYNVTASGRKALLSACWYLDHLTSGGDWYQFYECEPTNFNGTAEQEKLILGGEACMWAEVVNEYNIVQRIWPRASAPAEKLWSAKNDSFIYDDIAVRLEEHVCRMNRRGIPAQPPNAAGFCL